jgi:hypothetical protein
MRGISRNLSRSLLCYVSWLVSWSLDLYGYQSDSFEICTFIILSVIETCMLSAVSDVIGRTWRILEDGVWGT